MRSDIIFTEKIYIFLETTILIWILIFEFFNFGFEFIVLIGLYKNEVF